MKTAAILILLLQYHGNGGVTHIPYASMDACHQAEKMLDAAINSSTFGTGTVLLAVCTPAD